VLFGMHTLAPLGARVGDAQPPFVCGCGVPFHKCRNSRAPTSRGATFKLGQHQIFVLDSMLGTGSLPRFIGVLPVSNHGQDSHAAMPSALFRASVLASVRAGGLTVAGPSKGPDRHRREKTPHPHDKQNVGPPTSSLGHPLPRGEGSLFARGSAPGTTPALSQGRGWRPCAAG
jgi:hypothetical protein